MCQAVSGDLSGGGLMLIRRNTCPLDYRMCNQTVTVYHKAGDTITRTVHNRACLDFRKNQTVDKTGSREVNSFLLVIPGGTQAVFVGDKVMLGTGPEVVTQKDWAALVPSATANLVVVKYVDPKYWNGQLVHTEAGG